MEERALRKTGMQPVERIMVCCALTTAVLLGPLTHTAFAASRPVVVELFTSQGCSDCPPADALLRHVKAKDPGVLALDLHVTYWNSVAWTDPYSLASANDLQGYYAFLKESTEVYTPEAVVDGTAQFVGSDQAAMNAVIAKAHTAIATNGAIPVSVTTGGGMVSVHVGPGNGTATVWVFGFDPEHTTEVRGGENGGTTLTEVNVVRSITKLGTWNGQPLDRSIRAPAGMELAALVQRADGTILGATQN